MKIISKQPDYYHWVGKRFGEDPKHTYVVKKLTSTRFDASSLSASELELLMPDRWLRQRPQHEWAIPQWQPAIIIAGASAFCVMRHPLERARCGELLTEKHFPLMAYMPWDTHSRDWHPPKISVELVHKLQKIVGAPVFMLYGVKIGWEAGGAGRAIVCVSDEIPIMRDYGVPSVCSAQQMWQDVDHVVTSVLKKSPDLEPPLKISNEEKIIAAGFDLKTSFRGKQ